MALFNNRSSFYDNEDLERRVGYEKSRMCESKYSRIGRGRGGIGNVHGTQSAGVLSWVVFLSYFGEVDSALLLNGSTEFKSFGVTFKESR